MAEMRLAKSARQRILPGLAFSLSALALLGLVYFAWPVYRAFLPLQIDVNEPWNAYHADVLSAGEALYPKDIFVTNNYPPLSFYVVDALYRVTGIDALYIGRLLSLVAAVAIAFSVRSCTASLGGSGLAGALGAMWWLAIMSRFYASYVGMDDPHLVALAIMAWSLSYALRNPNSWRVGLAITLMALAGFYKQTLIATPTTTLCWWTIQDWRRGLRLILLGIGAISIGFAICGLAFGSEFFTSLLLPRHYNIAHLGGIGRLQFVAPALIIAAIWALCRRHNRAAQFLSIYMAIGFVSYDAEMLADGVADNAAFELIFAVAIAIGCVFDDLAAIPVIRSFSPERGQILLVCVLIGRLLFSLKSAPYLLLLSSNFRKGLDDRVSVMNAERMRIAAIEGNVACSVALACRLAGKPFVFDPFVVNEYIVTGKISAGEVSAKINERKIRFEEIDPRVFISRL